MATHETKHSLDVRHGLVALCALATSFILAACGGQNAGGDPAASGEHDQALTDVVVTEKPADAISVIDAKKLKAGDAVVVQGRIGGRKDPFIAERSALLLVDPAAVLACDAVPDDPCPTPWDFCCEPQERIAAAAALVQVRGPDGKALAQSLKGRGGMSAGDFLVVSGLVADGSSADNLLIDAEHIYVDSQRDVQMREEAHEHHEHHEDHDHAHDDGA